MIVCAAEPVEVDRCLGWFGKIMPLCQERSFLYFALCVGRRVTVGDGL